MSKAIAQKIISSPNGYTDESREAAEAYLKLLEPWVDAEKELPPEGQFVLVDSKYFKTMLVAAYLPREDNKFPWKVGDGTEFHGWSLDSVERWMALPKLHQFGESSTEGDFAGTSLDRRKDEWISVEDRLPENGDYVLTAQLYEIKLFKTNLGCVINTHIYENKEWFNEGSGDCDVGITHWRLLPSPPTEG